MPRDKKRVTVLVILSTWQTSNHLKPRVRDCLGQISLHPSLLEMILIDDLCGKAQLTMGSTIPRQVVLGCIWKLDKHKFESEQQAALLCGFVPGSCLSSHPDSSRWQTVTRKCTPNKPFPPTSCFGSECFLTETKWNHLVHVCKWQSAITDEGYKYILVKCVCLCACMCVYACMHVYIVHMRVRVCTCVWMCVCVCVSMHMCTHALTHIHTQQGSTLAVLFSETGSLTGIGLSKQARLARQSQGSMRSYLGWEVWTNMTAATVVVL